MGAACLAVASWPLLEASVRLAGGRKRRLDVRSSVEIGRPVADVFDFFKDFENLPLVVRGVAAVYDSQERRSHWVVRPTELSDAVRALLSRRPSRRMRVNLEKTRTYLESLSPSPATGALPLPESAD